MKTPDLDISDFDNREFTDALKVDFGRATRLVHSGSTCDAYDSMIQRRRVFIKRLKPECRDNPLSLKVIASLLNVTPTYLSRIRKKIH